MQADENHKGHSVPLSREGNHVGASRSDDASVGQHSVCAYNDLSMQQRRGEIMMKECLENSEYIQAVVGEKAEGSRGLFAMRDKLQPGRHGQRRGQDGWVYGLVRRTQGLV